MLAQKFWQNQTDRDVVYTTVVRAERALQAGQDLTEFSTVALKAFYATAYASAMTKGGHGRYFAYLYTNGRLAEKVQFALEDLGMTRTAAIHALTVSMLRENEPLDSNSQRRRRLARLILAFDREDCLRDVQSQLVRVFRETPIAANCENAPTEPRNTAPRLIRAILGSREPLPRSAT